AGVARRLEAGRERRGGLSGVVVNGGRQVACAPFLLRRRAATRRGTRCSRCTHRSRRSFRWARREVAERAHGGARTPDGKSPARTGRTLIPGQSRLWVMISRPILRGRRS